MKNKTSEPHLFEVQLNWIADKKGVLSSKEANGMLHIEAPPVFGGKGRPWTPEHFFLSAISGCFMTTFIAFADKMNFEVEDMECAAIGMIEIVEGRYKFTRIELYPKIFIRDEKIRDKAGLALEKTHKYCLITNSINADTVYHSQILVDRTFEKLTFIKREDPAESPVRML